MPKLVYADVQAYFTACYWYQSLQPLLTRFNRQDLDDLYTQTLLLHYFVSVKTHFDSLWPIRVDLGVTQNYLLSRRTPEIKRQLFKIAEKHEYSSYRDLINRGGEMARKQLIAEKEHLESLVAEIKGTMGNSLSQIDLEIVRLETELEEANSDNTKAISE